MAEQPSSISRDAKGIHQSIKELLRNKEPFEKEVDFQRKNLRRRYLNLLLVHPYANESKDAETRLWMETSHAFIAAYKQRISSLDHPNPHQLQKHQDPYHQHGNNPVEYRKLVQRFRQFLAEEEKFWTQFVVRFCAVFRLEEARLTLNKLGILLDEPIFQDTSTGNEEAGIAAPNLPHSGGRNHFQFPHIPEDLDSLAPKSDAQREGRMEILSKALTCLGDIARYRVQYNEAKGRPKAGYEDHNGPGAKRGRHKRGGIPGIPDLPRPRNYEKARQCYEQAKLLVPYEGNSSHQLAILASYQKDMFTSLYHYYRALCVRHPYHSALDNIYTVLHKALEQWKSRPKKGEVQDLTNAVPKIRVEAFKEKIVALYALNRAASEKYDSVTAKQSQEIFSEFYSLVSERHLPDDFIVQVIVLSQATLWNHRMNRDTPRSTKDGDRGSDQSTAGYLPHSVVEARLFTHVLSLHRALLEVGIEQLKEPAPLGSDDDLAPRLLVEFKRTLVALRIASKWLLANFKMVMQDPESLGQKSKNTDNAKKTGQISPSSTETIEFWEKYAAFLRVLARAFPVNKLPDLTFALSEDVEMRGFLPLKDMLEKKENKSANGNKKNEGNDEQAKANDIPTEEKEVHPNVVQLMRIKDLLNDAFQIVHMENSPLALYGNRFMLKGVEAQAQPIPRSDHTLRESEDDTDEILKAAADPETDAMTEATSRTDDDPVREAFEHFDDGDDEIVWNPKASPVGSPRRPLSSPSQPPAAAATPPHALPVYSPLIANVLPTVQQPMTSNKPFPTQSSPVKTPTSIPQVAKTTAEDLLNGFMNARASPSTHTLRPPPRRTPSDPAVSQTPSLLFGGNRSGNSIWSASQDEQVSMRMAAHNNVHTSLSPNHMHHPSLSPSHDVLRARSISQTQSMWPPSQYASTLQPMVPQPLAGSLPSPSAFSAQPQFGAQHRRAPSSSVAAQLFPDPVRNPGIPEYGYAPPITGRPGIEADPFNTSYGMLNSTQPPYGPEAATSIYDSSLSNLPAHSHYPNTTVMTNQHTRHLSFNNPQMNQQILGPSSSPLWGGAG